MGFKVHDLLCGSCGTEVYDYLHDDNEEFPQPCPHCGECALQLQFPAPDFTIHDGSRNVARKRNLAEAYKVKSQSYSYKYNSDERKEAKKIADSLMRDSATCADNGQK